MVGPFFRFSKIGGVRFLKKIQNPLQNVKNEEFSQILSILCLSKIHCLSISQKGPYQIFQFLSFSNKGVKFPIFPLTDHLDSKFSPEGPNASPWGSLGGSVGESIGGK